MELKQHLKDVADEIGKVSGEITNPFNAAPLIHAAAINNIAIELSRFNDWLIEQSKHGGVLRAMPVER